MNEATDHIDNELFRRMKQGDRAAFTSIYERYNKMLYLLASRYLQNSSMAEDAVQQVFTRLWEFHSEIYVGLNVRNYLFTMMKNYILNTIRNENKNYQIAYSEPFYEDTLIEKIEEKELKGILNRAISQLPEQKRMICLMKMEGKLTNQEIAQKLNLSANTVKTHYFQTIKMFHIMQHVNYCYSTHTFYIVMCLLI
mgnify:CR=1 FL=1